MIRLGELKGAKGSTHKVKRLGRGVGSGKGNTSGKGHKGLLARKGGGRRIGYEGGQTPMIRRIPKRGFHNFARTDYEVLNLSQLAASGLQDISIETLREAGVIRGQNTFLKILSVGEVTKVKSVKAHKVSAAAKAKLEKAGAKVEIIVPEVIDVRG